ncbi:MAG: peptide chain release factor 2 [Coriobacteriia bacterium]|nr:peptide chain release factor 2 [Coriobacteriia bacterium]
MIENRSSEIASLRERVAQMCEYLHIDARRAELAKLEANAAKPGFWDDQSIAQATMAQSSGIREEISPYEEIVEALDDAEVANEFALADNDEELAAEVTTALADAARMTDALEVSSWFTGEFDHGDAIVTITPGAGGLEAQDWAEMLLKMLTKYAERKKWKVELNDVIPGVEIGIDRATFTVHGRMAYGMLLSESGVHRLVRISPTDEKKRRQTTFAGVEVLPVLPDDVEVDVRDEDLRIDVYRSSGPGGQSVNTTDSAVRITHIPTGLVVTCQNEKSQHKNKDAAMKILRARLYEIEKEKRDAELDELRGPKRDISFGSQIRNYVLYPYQLVKDVRTGIETGNVDAVLDGDIDQFVVGYHRWRVKGEGAADDAVAAALADEE